MRMKAYKNKTMDPTLYLTIVEIMYKNNGITRPGIFKVMNIPNRKGQYTKIFNTLLENDMYFVPEGSNKAYLTDEGKEWYVNNVKTYQEIEQIKEEREEKSENLKKRKIERARVLEKRKINKRNRENRKEKVSKEERKEKMKILKKEMKKEMKNNVIDEDIVF